LRRTARARLRRLDQQLIDGVLANAGLADTAADRHPGRIAAGAIENFRRDQFIVKHDVGILQRAQRLDGEQIRIARAGANQRHPALGLARYQRAGERGGIGDIGQRGFCFIMASGQNQRADRAIDHTLPETAAQQHLGNAAMDLFAPAADEAGEIADPGRQHGFDALAHAARHHRRSAAGADRDNDVTAIDNGRKNERGMLQIVHHIDRQADRPGPRRHRHADIAGAGTQDRNDATKIGRQGIALRKLDPRHVGGIQSADIMIAIGRKPANPRARGRQQAQFRPHQVAGADKQHGTGLQIEKHRQESHAALAFPASGDGWNYLLYRSLLKPTKRKIFLLYCSATIEFSSAQAKGRRCTFSTTPPSQASCVAWPGSRDSEAAVTGHPVFSRFGFPENLQQHLQRWPAVDTM
jgi:hypothetical protein